MHFLLFVSLALSSIDIKEETQNKPMQKKQEAEKKRRHTRLK